MKIINYKKSKKEQVFEILDKQGYILDKEVYKIFGEMGLYKIHEYLRIWKKLKADREFFKDKVIVAKEKGHRMHLVKIKHNEQKELDNEFYKVGKEFWNEIKLKD
jgi:hypothetical protein